MLEIRRVEHLAHQLGVDAERLTVVTESKSDCREWLFRIEPGDSKRRLVLHVTGELRALQERLLHLLTSRISPSRHNYGGVPDREIKQNALAHRRSVHAFTTDISDFFPSISSMRIYRLFQGRFRCSPDVARICTKLCTYEHHLALGLVTSPFLSDQIMLPIDAELANACAEAGLTYTRFVDDLTISGRFNISRSGIRSVVRRIIGRHGFRLKKDVLGRLADGLSITKLRVRRGTLDVEASYIQRLCERISQVESLANGGPFDGRYFSDGQLRGQVYFVRWVNPGRGPGLLARLDAINWQKARDEALSRELVSERARLEPADYEPVVRRHRRVKVTR